MSYVAGIGPGLARWLNSQPSEPHIFCDSCGVKRHVTKSRGVAVPAEWFLNNKAAPGWSKRVRENIRFDFCPRCKNEVTR